LKVKFLQRLFDSHSYVELVYQSVAFIVNRNHSNNRWWQTVLNLVSNWFKTSIIKRNLFVSVLVITEQCIYIIFICKFDIWLHSFWYILLPKVSTIESNNEWSEYDEYSYHYAHDICWTKSVRYKVSLVVFIMQSNFLCENWS